MVSTLNTILLTSEELYQMRMKLNKMLYTKNDNIISNNFTSSSITTVELFISLYRCWCYNTSAVFSLCLLCQLYQHACNILFELYVFICYFLIIY